MSPKDKPTEPVRGNAGRYGPVLWIYKDELLTYDQASAKYEHDRAEWLEASFKRLSGWIVCDHALTDSSCPSCYIRDTVAVL